MNGDRIELSVIVPAHDEEKTIAPLVGELDAALDRIGRAAEIIVVDDGSTDATARRLDELRAGHPRLRVLSLPATATRRGNGQSIAFWWGFRAARGRLLASLDADLQNDPADLAELVERLERTGADLVQGDRCRRRRDGLVRRVSSSVGRLARRAVLSDAVRDTGCSLRVMRAEVARALPLQFRGMHRFIPVTARHLGYAVIECEVGHRPRGGGRSKYGIANRALPGLLDLAVVRWMHARRVQVQAIEGDGVVSRAVTDVADDSGTVAR